MSLFRRLLLLTLSLFVWSAAAQEDTIRNTLRQNLPRLPKIDEIHPSPIRGLFEVRVGNAIYYTDPTGNYLIEGELIETQTRRNLTAERLSKLTAIAFRDLPLKDAFTITRGNGMRRIAAFEDPNCVYCKQFESELQKVSNVTVYLFLYPVLGQDSLEKSQKIWCAPDKAKAWQDWMLHGTLPRNTRASGACDTEALSRNTAFGRQHRITGTPTILLADGTRIAGTLSAAQLEKMLTAP